MSKLQRIVASTGLAGWAHQCQLIAPGAWFCHAAEVGVNTLAQKRLKVFCVFPGLPQMSQQLDNWQLVGQANVVQSSAFYLTSNGILWFGGALKVCLMSLCPFKPTLDSTEAN